MKRITALLLCITIVLCVCGCKKETPKLISPVSFYYRSAEMVYDGTSAIISAEQRESAGFNGNMQLLLNAYFNGPVSPELTSPFPRSLKVISYSAYGATATVQVSSVISQIKGIDISIACACIASTILDMDESINRVQITSSGAYLDGTDSVTIARDDLLLLDTASKTLPKETESVTESIQ